MSHFARLAFSGVLLAAACSSSKAPEAQGAESPASLEAAAAAEPAAVNAATGEPVPASPAPEAKAEPTIATLFVADALADCQGEGARKCLRVRGSEAEQWRNFYGSIEGFDYEPSYGYELRVEVEELTQPPPDAPSIHYRLVEVVVKKKTGQ